MPRGPRADIFPLCSRDSLTRVCGALTTSQPLSSTPPRSVLLCAAPTSAHTCPMSLLYTLHSVRRRASWFAVTGSDARAAGRTGVAGADVLSLYAILRQASEDRTDPLWDSGPSKGQERQLPGCRIVPHTPGSAVTGTGAQRAQRPGSVTAVVA